MQRAAEKHAVLSNRTNPEKDDGQIVLLVDPECETCDRMKKAFSSAIDAGYIEVISTEQDEGAALIQQLGITVVPAFVVLVDEKVFSGAEVVAATPK